MNATLFAQVKRKLDITWDDEDTNNRVADIIETAEPVMLHKLGITGSEFDFSVAGNENLLFLGYCLYDWNHIANEFDDAYSNLIAQTRAIHEVEQYDETEQV